MQAAYNSMEVKKQWQKQGKTPGNSVSDAGVAALVPAVR